MSLRHGEVTGSSVYFVTIRDLVGQFQPARDEDTLKERMSLLVKPRLVILDEMGYLSPDRFAATCLFQLVSERYEKGSIILTSNKSYVDWGAISADNVIASAVCCTTLCSYGPHDAKNCDVRFEPRDIVCWPGAGDLSAFQ